MKQDRNWNLLFENKCPVFGCNTDGKKTVVEYTKRGTLLFAVNVVENGLKTDIYQQQLWYYRGQN